MAYKLNEKKYKAVFTTELTFEMLKSVFQKVYDEMCDYHGKKITDHKHYIKYMKRRHGRELSTADAKEIIGINMNGEKVKDLYYQLSVNITSEPPSVHTQA